MHVSRLAPFVAIAAILVLGVLYWWYYARQGFVISYGERLRGQPAGGGTSGLDAADFGACQGLCAGKDGFAFHALTGGHGKCWCLNQPFKTPEFAEEAGWTSGVSTV